MTMATIRIRVFWNESDELRVAQQIDVVVYADPGGRLHAVPLGEADRDGGQEGTDHHNQEGQQARQHEDRIAAVQGGPPLHPIALLSMPWVGCIRSRKARSDQASPDWCGSSSRLAQYQNRSAKRD